MAHKLLNRYCLGFCCVPHWRSRADKIQNGSQITGWSTARSTGGRYLMNDKSSNHFTRRRLHYAIALVASASAMPVTFAQQSSEPTLEEVVVTGSRMQRADNATSPHPLAVISAEDLSSSASVDIGEILNENPALLASVTSTNSLDGQAANVGRASNQGGTTTQAAQVGGRSDSTLAACSVGIGLSVRAVVKRLIG